MGEIFTIGKGCYSIQTNNEIILYLLQENFLVLYACLLLETLLY